MAKASPLIRSFNAALFSPTLEGRTDIEQYNASMKEMRNFIALSQGPIIRRSGTSFMCPVYDETKRSALVPFVFSNEQSQMLEFAEGRVRFIGEDGITIRTPVAATALVATTPSLKLTVPGHGHVAGEQVALIGFPAASNLSGTVANVTLVAGNDITIAWPNFTPLPALVFASGMQVARVYHVVSPYLEADLENLRYLQSADVLFLFCQGYRPRKLGRYGTYDWRLSQFAFEDGPFVTANGTNTTLTPSGLGGLNLSGATATAGTGTAANAFDGSYETAWQSTAINQSDYISVQLTTAQVLKRYVFYSLRNSANATYSPLDYAPSNWVLAGSNDGFVTSTVLDTVTSYVLYDGGKSAVFEIANTTAFLYYRWTFTGVRVNGPIGPALSGITMGGDPALVSAITLTASSVVGINQDAGFKATDVGRLIRLRSADNVWRSVEIVGYVSATQVTCRPQSEPLPDVRPMLTWRLGAYSDTTGWPVVGTFFEDRLWLGGSSAYPDLIVGSKNGEYETFSQTDALGAIADNSAIVQQLNARKLSPIVWLGTDERGLLIGTGAGEWVISGGDNNAPLTPTNLKARNSTARGSAFAEPVKVDRQILYIQRSRRTLREFSYVYEADGYKSPSMSLYAPHVGTPKFKEMDYAAEPHSIVWLRRGDGTYAGFTYNKDENVKGWHEHDMAAGGYVESLAVKPDTDNSSDAPWFAVKRVVNGHERRYIERLRRFWDYDSTLDEAHFVDSALRYVGEPTNTIYGLAHLEGEEVDGLADGAVFPTQTVVNGRITLPFEAANIVIGLGYESYAETARLEAGAADGTAQGKTKRIHNVSIRLWETGGGEFGRPASRDLPDGEMEVLEHRRPDDLLDAALPLFSGDHGPIPFPPGYEGDGRIAFRQRASIALPLNVVAIMPQMHTIDR